MIDDKFLDKWVRIIVPIIYGPNKNPDSGKAILGIYVITADEMAAAKKLWFSDVSEEVRVYGQLIDMGELESLVGRSGKLDGKYVIRLNASQSEACGIFTLAHEIGHLHGLLNEKEKHDLDPDEYADNYAFKRVKDVIEESELRVKIYTEAFLTERL